MNEMQQTPMGDPTPNQTPNMNQTVVKKTDVGAIVGSLIIIALLLLAGWYFYTKLETPADNMEEQTMEETDPTTPEELDEDLSDNNPFDAIEEDLNDIDAEFESETTVQ